MTDVTFRHLERNQTDAEHLFPLIQQLNPDMARDYYEQILSYMFEAHIKFIGMFTEQGKLIGAAGYWIGARFYCGRMMHMDNFVVDDSIRGQGLGKRLFEWLQEEAKRNGCSRVIFDSYVHSAEAHRFYFREGCSIKGFHFNRMLNDK